MSSGPVIASLVVSSLKRTDHRRMPLLRKIFTPATWLLQRHYGGVWIAGDVHLTAEVVAFAPNALSSKLHRDTLAWSIRLGDLTEVVRKKGMMMETLEFHHAGGVQTLKCIGAEAFLRQLEEARIAAPTRVAEG